MYICLFICLFVCLRIYVRMCIYIYIYVYAMLKVCKKAALGIQSLELEAQGGCNCNQIMP